MQYKCAVLARKQSWGPIDFDKLHALHRPIGETQAVWGANADFKLALPPIWFIQGTLLHIYMQKRKKPTKALESCAREIRNSDDFVDHIASIADRYRREHALDAGSRSVHVRRAMREFQKHARPLADWLKQAHKAVSQAEFEVLGRVGAMMHGMPHAALPESKPVLDWLVQAEHAVSKCLSDAARSSRKSKPNAPRIAAEALRATFEYHKIRWSAAVTKTKSSDAVRLLCAIAKGAGDVAMTPATARMAIREAR